MDQERKKILVVEDDHDAASMMRDFLELEGQWVSIANDGEEGLKMFEEFSPDLVLLDLQLPKIDGYSFCQKIREKSNCPIFVVSGHIDSTEDMRKIFALQVSDIFEKPVNLDSLLSKIRLYLQLQKAKKTYKELEEEVLKRRHAEESLKAVNDELKEVATCDILTGFFDAKYFEKRLFSEYERAKRYFISLSIAIIDLDEFESLSERYGESSEDAILKKFSRFLKGSMRACDIPIRYGKKEFIVLLPNTPLFGAYTFGEHLLENLSKRRFNHNDQKITLRASLGVTSYPENGAIGPEMFLNQAEQALDLSKQNGGNQLRIFHAGDQKDISDLLNSDGQKDFEEIKEKIAQLASRVNRAVIDSICSFARTAKAKDQYPTECIEEAIKLATLMGQELNLSSDNIDNLKHAAILHDLGKVGVDAEILQKKGKLTSSEIEAMHKHPIFGAEILRPIHFLRDIVSTVLYHHERYDGQGYPAGLSGEQIPLDARIMAIVDVFEALRFDRPYRKAYSEEEAIEIIKKGSGTEFDPKIVDAFLNVVNRL